MTTYDAKGLTVITAAWGLAATLSVVSVLAFGAAVVPPARSAAVATGVIDRSGRRQIGKASFYADHYAGKTMADGTPMRPDGNNAAMLTLPLGATARVTNLATGRSAIVTIRDRGPYIRGRIIDLSPATARRIGLAQRQGLARVVVEPLSIPMADGSLKIFRHSLLLASNRTPGA